MTLKLILWQTDLDYESEFFGKLPNAERLQFVAAVFISAFIILSLLYLRLSCLWKLFFTEKNLIIFWSRVLSHQHCKSWPAPSNCLLCVLFLQIVRNSFAAIVSADLASPLILTSLIPRQYWKQCSQPLDAAKHGH